MMVFSFIIHRSSFIVSSSSFFSFWFAKAERWRVTLILQPIQSPINALTCDQFLVGSRFTELALMHNQDPIRILDRGKAVSDDQSGPSSHELGEPILDEQFGLRINTGSRFVQNQDGGIIG